jgi:hypothetical protein
MTSANKINSIVLASSLAGFLWLMSNFIEGMQLSDYLHVGCPVKNLTGIPCPSCGITRALVYVIKGQPGMAFTINPLSYIVGLIMIIAPLWIIFDIWKKKDTFIQFYNKTENLLKKKGYAMVFIVLIMLNWIYIIYKGL